MNGYAADAWPYVIAAYAATWVVFIGYALRLVTMTRRNDRLIQQMRENA